MSNFTTFTADELLDHLVGGVDSTPDATLYFALFTTATDPSGGGTEVSTGSYARVAVTNNLTEWPSASGGTKANANAIVFPTPTLTWGTVTHFAFFDALTVGNMLMQGALTASKTINSGDTVQFDAAAVDITFA